MNLNKYYTDIFGYICAIVSVLLYIPQLIHIIKRKSAKDVSSTFIILSILSGLIWTIYGFLIDSKPIIICDILIMIISILILIAKYYYDNIYKINTTN